MISAVFLAEVIDPGLKFLTAAIVRPDLDSPEARVMLMAIAGQESAWSHRRQIGGPARSYWQFEKGGGVAGVLAGRQTGPWVKEFCDTIDIPFDAATIFEAMAWSDHLAVAMARFNLWLVPGALPALGAQDRAWTYYVGQWRPGKPHPAAWPANYQTALKAVTGSR